MLTRITIRRQPAFYIRLLSDKTGDTDSKNVTVEIENNNAEEPKPSPVKKSAANLEKIQALLKSMVKDNKAKEEKEKIEITTAPGFFSRKPQANIIKSEREQIEEKVTAAVSEVAATLGGDTKQTEAELLSRVLGDVTQAPTNLSDLVLGMKIDRSKEPEDGFKMETRGQQVRRLIDRVGQNKPRPPVRRDTPAMRKREPMGVMAPIRIDVFSEKPLGILKATDTPNYGPRMDTWERLKERELSLAVTQPPRNYFEKMIQWTEQGKVWKFPIDNEQGMDEEAKVHFSEHVFVENHLEGWCPERGPVRHFMELVCVGLSKNPFYTVQEKKDHIMWFKEYFESKKDILHEVDPANPIGAKSQITKSA